VVGTAQGVSALAGPESRNRGYARRVVEPGKWLGGVDGRPVTGPWYEGGTGRRGQDRRSSPLSAGGLPERLLAREHGGNAIRSPRTSGRRPRLASAPPIGGASPFQSRTATCPDRSSWQASKPHCPAGAGLPDGRRKGPRWRRADCKQPGILEAPGGECRLWSRRRRERRCGVSRVPWSHRLPCLRCRAAEEGSSPDLRGRSSDAATK
jgi:hypothetical protein